MSKPLPLDDFRAVRIVLESDDFALGAEEPEHEPPDLIPRDIWEHLVTLPDDVSVRTSAHFGTVLKNLTELQHEFVCLVLAIQESLPDPSLSPMAHASSMNCDDFQSATYNALTGYYRLAFTALRCVVENITVGMQLELSADHARFQRWLSGEELRFGWAADHVRGSAGVARLEAHLQSEVKDDLFRQKRALHPDDGGGFARRLFGKLSQYTHGGPGFSDSDLRESNGPVFVGQVFVDWAVCFVQTLAFSLVACKLAIPSVKQLGGSSTLDVQELYEQVSGMLRHKDDGVAVFGSLPPGFW